jgi:hypothetical protein
MYHASTKRTPCAVCSLETLRHAGWFLVVENRWRDRLKILSWHSSLASQKGMKSVCCTEHLKAFVAHWLTQDGARFSAADFSPTTIAGNLPLNDIDLGPDAVDRLVGELAVHRESFSRVWSGSPEALECILDALITIGAESKIHALEFQLFDPAESTHGLSFQ